MHITARQKDYHRTIFRTEKIQSCKGRSKEPYVRCFLWQNDPPTLTRWSNSNRPRTLGYEDGDGHENIKTAIGLVSKTTRTAHDYEVKIPNFTFCWERKQATTKFSFSFWTWTWSLGIQLQESSPTIDNTTELVKNNRDEDQQNANSLFKRSFRCHRRPRILRSLIFERQEIWVKIRI